MHRLVLSVINLHTKLEALSYACFKDRTGPKSLKWVPTPWFVTYRLGLVMVSLYTKFEVSSLAHCKDVRT